MPFARLLRAIAPLASESRLELFVQRGPGTEEFAYLPGAAMILREQFAERLTWADVVVCHGGAGTLYEAHRAGHRPLVMPRLARFGEHVNDHQDELVVALAKRGLAVRLHGPELLAAVRSATHRSAAPVSGAGSAMQLAKAVEEQLLGMAGPSPRTKLRRAAALPWALATRSLDHLRHSVRPRRAAPHARGRPT
jgi:UDP-N-acetylglucosamine transferase subunit ALG13